MARLVAADVIAGATLLSEAELGYLDGVTAGTAAASKALVVDANKDIGTVRNVTMNGELLFDAGGSIEVDEGTATASSDAATVSKMAGKVTSEAKTTAAAGSFTLTITNTVVAATSIILCSVANGTNTQGIPVIALVTPGAGSFTVQVFNLHASQALNGTLVVSFLVLKTA